MRIKLVLFLLLIQSYHLKAQSSLSVGIDVNYQLTGLSPGYAYAVKQQNIYIPGLGIGILKSFKGDKIQLKSGVGYHFSGLEFENIAHIILENGHMFNVGTMDQEIKQNFISIPLAINYTVLHLNKFDFQLFGGTQLLYLYRTRYKQNSTYNGETVNVTRQNEIYPLMDLGLSFYFKPQEKIQLFVKPKYTYATKEILFSDENNMFGVNFELYYSFR